MIDDDPRKVTDVTIDDASRKVYNLMTVVMFVQTNNFKTYKAMNTKRKLKTGGTTIVVKN